MAAGPQDFDIVIIGAGFSGINSAYLLQKQLPDAKYVVLEARDTIAGTWSYWQYPGARSDSPSAIFGFDWHSWPNDRNYADADFIRDYIQSAMRAQGIDRHLRLQQRVDATRWSSEDQMWTLDVTHTRPEPQTVQYRARWVVHASGYYSYDQAQQVAIPGLAQFRGDVVHPQFWAGRPGDDAAQRTAAAAASAAALAGKRVVLIGSGATAVTMLPHVARVASQVTMLQRSPSYVLSLPRHDPQTALLRRYLRRRLADWLNWYVHMVGEVLMVLVLGGFPGYGRRMLRTQAQRQLPPDIDVDVHFNPRYGPFEQRMCLAADGDFYKALHQPNCTIVTGTIDTVTAAGVRVQTATGWKGGEPTTLLPADTIITATGMHMQLLDGKQPCVDGVPVEIGERFAWRSCMIEGIPNACFLFGYITGTWVPGADTRFRTVLSVLRRMRQRGATSAWPTIDQVKRPSMPQLPLLGYSSGYMVSARKRLPMSCGKYPWVNGLSWVYDTWYNLVGSPDDGMVYRTADKKNV